MSNSKKRFSIARKEFEDLVFQTIKELPRQFRKRMDNIEIVIEERPSLKILHDLHFNSPKELLGLYHGIPLKKRSTYYGNCLPDRIVLYKENIENSASNKMDLKMQIRNVLFHEIGHHFGLDEDELEEID
jgi:predicted Zn-dependent protease with MMP-like domain